MKINLVSLVLLLVLACNEPKKDVEITVTKAVFFNLLHEIGKTADISYLTITYYLLVKNNTDRNIELELGKHQNNTYKGFLMTYWTQPQDTIYNGVKHILDLAPKDTLTVWFSIHYLTPDVQPQNEPHLLWENLNKYGRSGKLWYRNAQNQDTFETYFFNIPVFYTTHSNL